MGWFTRRSENTFSQTSLWDALDAAGIPFRKPLGDLIASYGTVPSGWNDSVRYCPLQGGETLVPALAHPLAVQVQSGSDLRRAPMELVGYIRQYERAEKNLATAEKSITRLFGAGRNAGASNTIERHWGAGHCTVAATVFPPRLQRFGLQNSRHDAVSGSATECAIRIRPDWWPDLTAQEQGWLEGWQLLVCGDLLFVPAPLFDNASRPIPPNLAAQSGFGMSNDGTGLVAVYANGRAVLLSRDRIVAVGHDVLTPAKGGGQSNVSVTYDRADLPNGRLLLLSDSYDAPDHQGIAQDVANRLGVVLKTTKFADA
ncbi:MAG: hypothetical protein QNL92_05100 [Octadecabacter sp.]